MAVAEDRDWDAYFAAVASFLIESERQYGVCNDQYTNYALEQLEFLQVTCRTLIRVVSQQTMSRNCNGTSGRVILMIFIGITIATAVQQWWIDGKLLYKAC